MGRKEKREHAYDNDDDDDVVEEHGKKIVCTISKQEMNTPKLYAKAFNPLFRPHVLSDQIAQ